MMHLRRRRIAGVLLAMGTVGAALVGACAEKKGALMLAVDTDMKAPKDVNAVSITVSTNGAIKHSFIGRVTPEGDVLLPATLAIVEPEDKSAPIRVRVMAFQGNRPRVLRDVRTTIPSGGRTALLRIPLNFASDASAVGDPLPDGLVSGSGLTAAEFDFFGAYQPPCADIQNQTIIDGECADNFVDPAALPDFDQAALGNSTDQASCFDVARCFAGASTADGAEGSTVRLDRSTCTLQLNGSNPARLNLALVTPDTGECVQPGQCYVPIDRGAGGWIDDQGAVKLPSFVCRLLEGKSLHLAASRETCAAKVEANPICREPAPGGPQTNVACTEFKLGSPVDPGIGGSVASQVAVQSVADYATSASTTLAGVTASCRTIAKDLGAPTDAQSAADASTDAQAKMKAWCTLAASAIGSAKAMTGGNISVQTRPAKCQLSVSEKTACQRRCAGGTCDAKANPPRCTGGSLVGACSGSCQPGSGGAIQCEGNCVGECNGTCTSTAGVACAGKCTGTCTASAAGSGPQPDGSCKGSCKGTCAATAPGAICMGTCAGACNASCNGDAAKPVKCDGQCAADFVPLYCEGGRLEGGCNVDARCDASCDVSVVAGAECPPQTVFVAIQGAADPAAAAKLRAALESSFGAILAFGVHVEQMATIGPTLSSNAVVDIKASCVPLVVAAVNSALGDVSASFSATSTVASAVGQ
ncbi:MAG: Tryptophan synthase alpha chain [Labilithrix sp.]|nr:Tryptophan synthase alpha chain [Labilithrix sp.]